MFNQAKKSWTLKSDVSSSEKKNLDVWTISSPSENEGGHNNLPGGISYWVAAYFMVAQLAGAGFLALPRAFADSGWAGAPLLIIFCFCAAYAGTRLGHCWVILEERWPEYRQPVRQPYMEIAGRAYGKLGRNTAMVSVLAAQIGSSIVYIILIAQFLRSLIPQVSMCVLVIIIGCALIPFTWPGTPKDFWQASVLAVVATFIACAVIFVQLLLDKDTFPDPTYPPPTFESFSLSFGTILFAFGGASVFPTIQNDMKDKTQFWKSVAIAFGALIIMYFPVALTGYTLLGFEVPTNILLYAGDNLTLVVKIAVGFQVVNLIATYLIAFNPVCQIFEEALNVPRDINWKRIVLRSSIVLIEILIALAFPDFGLIVNLVGGSMATLTSFLLPTLIYRRLVNDKSNVDWPERTIPAWEKILLWSIFIIGVIGGLSATGSAILGIVNTPMSASCFSQFLH